MASYLDLYRGGVASARRRSEDLTQRLIKTVEVGAGAFAAAYLSNKLGGPTGKEYHKIPLEVGLGAVLLGASMAGLGGSHDEDLVNLADGAFAAWATRQGLRSGNVAAGAVSGSYYELGAGPQAFTGQDRANILKMAGIV